MPQSFIKRFAGREQETVDKIKLFGWSNFCKREGISGFSSSLQEWFQKQKGCENDSILQYISSDSSVHDLSPFKRAILDLQAVQSKHAARDAHYETLLAEKDREIAFLKDQYRDCLLQQYRGMQPVLEVIDQFCRGELCNQPIRGDPLRI